MARKSRKFLAGFRKNYGGEIETMIRQLKIEGRNSRRLHRGSVAEG
jgi:hypothetical protein